MYICTIMDYPNDWNHNLLSLLWVHLLNESNPRVKVIIYTFSTIPEIVKDYCKRLPNITIEKLSELYTPTQQDLDISKGRIARFTFCKKLPLLTAFKEPCIFIDCDALVLEDLSELWELRKQKPFLCTKHQNLNGVILDYLNTGVCVIGEVGFLKWDPILQLMRDTNFDFYIGGDDQPALDGYFRKIQYDCFHPKFDETYNACANLNKLERDSKGRWRAFSKESNKIVKIHHYWNIKPWQQQCELFEYYNRKTRMK